ncbi:hypothetical protein BHE74_00006143 [Ensete ventricosum]|nr:hypothetical protein BHE74_00006143 [Ensete ventricosum]
MISPVVFESSSIADRVSSAFVVVRCLSLLSTAHRCLPLLSIAVVAVAVRDSTAVTIVRYFSLLLLL